MRSPKLRLNGFNVPVEPLESRRLMSVTLGANLIVNPGAEASATVATGWTNNGSPAIVKYGASGFPSATSPGPSSRGVNFFAGGGTHESDLFQTIDVSSLASSIDAGSIKFTLSGYLGGFATQLDQTTLFANFQNATHGFVNQASVGPVTAANRANITGLLSRTTTAVLPAGTRFIQVQQHFDAVTGGYNDGYANNLSLTLVSTASTTSIAGTVYNDLNGDGVHQTTEAGLANVVVFIDKNANGKLDTGELKQITAASGAYTFSNVAIGAYKVMAVVPAQFRASSLDPASVTVSATATPAVNFEVTQTALISGAVFNDANANKVRDPAEKGLAGVTVYLDFNNNGQLDSFDLKAVTDAAGNYKFNLPFGSYVVREVLPAGKVQTTPLSGLTLTLAKGAVVSGLNFGDK